MGAAPLVSIVVPCYKHEAFVAQCLDSIFHQTYKELEIIVIDDASPDDSARIIDEIVKKPAFIKRFAGRVTYIARKDNKGAHHTINEGLALAKGDYVAIVNSDDLYVQDRFTLMIAAMQERGASFAFSQVGFVDEHGNEQDDTNDDYYNLSRVQKNIADFPTVGFALLGSQCSLSTGNFLFTRQLLEKIGLFADLKYCHDWDFILKALLVEEPLYIERVLYLYRIHSSNSFRALSDIATKETAELITRFLRNVMLEQYSNVHVPSPKHWPGIFESFIEFFGYKKYLAAARAA